MTLRELQHLAAAMAHEVRNPLNSMAIHAELIEGRLKKADKLAAADREAIQKSATVMAGEIERIDRILEEFLEHAGPPDAARRPSDAAHLIAEAIAGVRPEAEQRGVGLEVRARGELGTWAVDGAALVDALEAILRNAVQASPRGAVVELSARTADEEAELIVSDHGEGIAKEDLPRVFHLGFSRRGRDGVGLTVAKQIVKGHGGSILVASGGKEQGATFTLHIPLEAEPSDEDLVSEEDDLDDA